MVFAFGVPRRRVLRRQRRLRADRRRLWGLAYGELGLVAGVLTAVAANLMGGLIGR